MSIDWNKPIQNKLGEPRRYLGRVDNLVYPRVAVRGALGRELPETYTEDGKCYSEGWSDDEDLMNVPEPKRKIWAAVYTDGYVLAASHNPFGGAKEFVEV